MVRDRGTDEMSDHDILVALSTLVEERFNALDQRLTARDDVEDRRHEVIAKTLDDHETQIRLLDKRLWLAIIAGAIAGGGTSFGVEKFLGG